MTRGRVEVPLDVQCRAVGLPKPAAEYQFARYLSASELQAIGQVKPRMWKVDWVLVPYRLAIEVEGGYAGVGRHTSVKGFLGDMEKYNALACLGWRLIRVTPRDVRSGAAVTWIQRALGQRKGLSR